MTPDRQETTDLQDLQEASPSFQLSVSDLVGDVSERKTTKKAAGPKHSRPRGHGWEPVGFIPVWDMASVGKGPFIPNPKVIRDRPSTSVARPSFDLAAELRAFWGEDLLPGQDEQLDRYETFMQHRDRFRGATDDEVFRYVFGNGRDSERELHVSFRLEETEAPEAPQPDLARDTSSPPVVEEVKQVRRGVFRRIFGRFFD